MSKQHSHINDDLLVKYLVDEATPTEAAEVEAWLTADIANTAHYAQLKRIWDESLALAAKSSVDEDAAYTRLQNRIKTCLPIAARRSCRYILRKQTGWQ
jgi:transmembrane sensor